MMHVHQLFVLTDLGRAGTSVNSYKENLLEQLGFECPVH